MKTNLVKTFFVILLAFISNWVSGQFNNNPRIDNLDFTFQNGKFEITYKLANFSKDQRYYVRADLLKVNDQVIPAKSFTGDVNFISVDNDLKRINLNYEADDPGLNDTIYARLIVATTPAISTDKYYFQSTLMPGLGSYKITGNKKNYFFAVLGYGSLAGAVFSGLAVSKNYNEYKKTGDAAMYDKSVTAKKNASALAGVAVAVWVANYISLSSKTKKMKSALPDFKQVEKENRLITAISKAKPVYIKKQGQQLVNNININVNNSNNVTININEKRVALIIGNSKYASAPLRNPVNDAIAMSEELRKLDFDVITVTNGTFLQMKKAVSDYGTKLSADKNTVGLFYYAGHGVQVKGKNYLVPVDANIEKEPDVEVYCMDMEGLLSNLEYARNNMNIIILDACRNNPFARSFRSAASTGLATVNAPTGTFVAFATAPGSTANDGEGKNGLYTQELIKAIQNPSMKLEDVFKKVRTQVKEKSQGQQIPWENSALEGDFYFKKTK